MASNKQQDAHSTNSPDDNVQPNTNEVATSSDQKRSSQDINNTEQVQGSANEQSAEQVQDLTNEHEAEQAQMSDESQDLSTAQSADSSGLSDDSKTDTAKSDAEKSDTAKSDTEKSVGKPQKKKRQIGLFSFISLMMVMLLIGLGLVLYPTIADLHNRRVASRAVGSYVEAVADTPQDTREDELKKANEYNKSLVNQGNIRFSPREEQKKVYDSILDVTGTGIMAYLTVPKLSLSVPIYHGTSDTVLQIAAGHLEGSSFPVGGPSTHAAVSGHTGLPSAMLFTGLDRLTQGDTFSVTVYEETLTYEVDAIHVVEPDDLSPLEIQKGRDLMSLITCTPYGINSHRLIVTGHRIPTPDNLPSRGEVEAVAMWKDIGLIVAIVLVVGGATYLILRRRGRTALMQHGVRKSHHR
ncbi:sortase [Bifidobacterium dolichotidis]|uniref:Sortase n=1 Tax=Bifidobacterium dolichotidis TaxID=2306976 RepID=A0A430FRR3_9BIFI|nr:class C sortase [Bifidobacterium dolichotidis]RSX55558.1 sortase [Bifidobacterium dolichotidis]